MHSMKQPGGDAFGLRDSRARGELTSPETILVEEEVLRDLRHELGNHFHRLYFWAESLEGDASGQEALLASGQTLLHSVGKLEEYLNLALRYFEPNRPAEARISVRELGEAVDSYLRTERSDARVELRTASDLERAQVAVDPERLSLLLRIVARRLHAGLTNGSVGSCTCRLGAHQSGQGDRTVKIEMAIAGLADKSRAGKDFSVMEWAVARKCAAMLGGVVYWEQPDGGERCCTLTLPLLG
jgi:hypothetical protein